MLCDLDRVMVKVRFGSEIYKLHARNQHNFKIVQTDKSHATTTNQ